MRGARHGGCPTHRGGSGVREPGASRECHEPFGRSDPGRRQLLSLLSPETVPWAEVHSDRRAQMLRDSDVGAHRREATLAIRGHDREWAAEKGGSARAAGASRRDAPGGGRARSAPHHGDSVGRRLLARACRRGPGELRAARRHLGCVGHPMPTYLCALSCTATWWFRSKSSIPRTSGAPPRWRKLAAPGARGDRDAGRRSPRPRARALLVRCGQLPIHQGASLGGRRRYRSRLLRPRCLSCPRSTISYRCGATSRRAP